MSIKIADGFETGFPTSKTQSLDGRAVTTLATFTVLLLDYCLTLPDEVELVWSRSWTRMGTLLFVLNRYLPFVDTIVLLHAQLNVLDLEDCVREERIVAWIAGLGIILSETILVLRTMALWSGYKAVTGSLLIFFTATVVSGLTFFQLWANSNEWYPQSEPPVPGCMIAKSNPKIVCVFALILAFETVIVCLTALRARYHLSGGSTAWLSRLYHQGFQFYIYMLAIVILNVAWPLRVGTKPYNTKLFIVPQRVLHSIMCNRVFFIVFRRRPLKKLRPKSCQNHVTSINHGGEPEGIIKTSVGIVDSIMTAPSEWFGEASDLYAEEGEEETEIHMSEQER